MSVFPMESRRSPAATDGLEDLVLAAIQYSQTGSAWDQPFPWHSAGSEPQQPVAMYFGAFVGYFPYAAKQLLKPATVGIGILKA